MEYGIVYLLTNPVMPGLVKIGMMTQEDIEKDDDNPPNINEPEKIKQRLAKV